VDRPLRDVIDVTVDRWLSDEGFGFEIISADAVVKVRPDRDSGQVMDEREVGRLMNWR